MTKEKKQRINKELEEKILQEKVKGTSDIEIGQKFGVTFKYIEKLVTKTHGINVSAFKISKKIKRLQPRDFKEEQTTVWSFKQRGDWATHSGEYRGNWSPYIPRNIILKYTKPGDIVLDYFCGAGTTAVECKLLGRRCIAFDINDKAIELAKRNISFKIESEYQLIQPLEIYEPELAVADARDLSFLPDNSIDLICSHPPYANIIHYTDGKEGDLSFLGIEEFLNEMRKVARESFRVLKPGRKCAILIGDARRKKHIIPLGFRLINVFLDIGFKLQELVIKRQHNCKTTGFWYEKSVKHNFLLLAHEYLPIFEKPEGLTEVKESKYNYGMIIPVTESPAIEKRLDRLETTTVWILSEDDLEERLIKNVIDRYAMGDKYIIITFPSKLGKGKHPKINEEKKMQLLFIKFPFLNKSFSSPQIDIWLRTVNEIVNETLPSINKNGFVVIQAKDIRVGDYIEPTAIKLVNILTDKRLWLKEIIIVSSEKKNLEILNDKEKYLKIVHQYLLVYEVV